MDVILFPLAGCDLILGMQWLRTLGPITWDCSELTMEFTMNGERSNYEQGQKPKFS